MATRKHATKSKSKPKPKSKSKSKSKSKVDLAGYLRAWNEYPVAEVRTARCTCKGDVFAVEIDDSSGAKRTCVACKHEHLLCDSAEFWDEAEPDECACPCGNETFRLAAGFAFYEGTKDVRWIYIGLQCTKCDAIGVYGDWKIDYSPSNQLLDQV